MKSNELIAGQFSKHKGISTRGLSDQYANARDCQAFYNGNVMSLADTLGYTDRAGRQKQTMVEFKLVKPYVNAVRGFMAQNRRNADYVAKIDDSEKQSLYSEWANALKDYVRDNAGAAQIETKQDGDQLIAGVGAVETALTYGDGYSTRNPNGEIIMGNLDLMDTGWDPSSRMTNLVDSRWVYYKKIYARTEALSLFDLSEEDGEDLEPANDLTQDGPKMYNPRGGRYDKIQRLNSGYDWDDEDEDLIKVYFYQWYEIEKFYRARNPVSTMQDPVMKAYFDNIMQEIAAEQEEDDLFKFDPRAEIISCDSKTRKELEDVFEDMVDFESFNRRVYYTAVLSGRKVFTKYRSPCQQGFTIKFKTGDYDDIAKIWVGMVNSLKEPTLYYNKALTELMFVIASQSKGGVMYESGAIENIQEFEANYLKTNGHVEVATGALSGSQIQPKKEQYTANGIDQIIQLSSDAMPMVSGIDRSFFGSSESMQETASLQRQRIKQVMTVLATYFDSGDAYQREHAKMLLPLMRILVDNNDGSMFRAMTSEGDVEYLRMSPDNFVDEYDVTIQEAPDTATQKDEQAQFLFSMSQQLLSVGDMASAKKVMAIGLKYTSLKFRDQMELIETLIPKDQPIDPQMVQQLQAQLQQIQSEITQAEVKQIQSTAALNLVKAEQVIADINKSRNDAAKTQAETDTIELENHILVNTPPPPEQVNLSI